MAFGSYINLLPYTRYQLEIGSPQPAFSSAYQFIKDAKKPSDKVISPYASMTNIYLGEPGLLLPISLSGRSSELAGTTAGGIDYYTGAPALLDLEYFSKMISNDTGFIVLDNMAEDRIRKTYLPLIKTSPNIREVFQKTSGPDKVKVYKFEPLLVEIEKI